MAASTTPSRKKSLTWLVPASLGAGALALSLVTGSLGAFTAQIQNDKNTAGAGALTIQEQGKDAANADTTCTTTGDTNSVTCSSINKYGGKTTLLPGKSSTATVTLSSTGTVDPTVATLTPGTCTAGYATNGGTKNLCDQIDVTVTETPTKGTGIPSVTKKASALTTGGAITLTPPTKDNPIKYTITVTLPDTSTNGYNGTSISQPLTWNFTA